MIYNHRSGIDNFFGSIVTGTIIHNYHIGKTMLKKVANYATDSLFFIVSGYDYKNHKLYKGGIYQIYFIYSETIMLLCWRRYNQSPFANHLPTESTASNPKRP